MSQGKAALERENQKDYDPPDPEVKQNPYSYYAKLRREEPVKWMPSLVVFAFEFDNQGGSRALSNVHAVLPAHRGEVPVQTRPN